MKILSFNVRGLGVGEKRSVIREVVNQNYVEMLCIQETKVQSVDRRLCFLLWGDSDFDWRAIPAVNSAGGLLCIWNAKAFAVEEVVQGGGFLGLVGVWTANHHRCVIVNIYFACGLADKRALWSSLLEWRQQCQDPSWCLLGDFNAVRYEDKRRGVAGVLPCQRREMAEFNLFIDNMELLDLPLAGRKFTWRRPNNQAHSRIDRFLVSKEWCDAWPNCSQLVLNRDISDHSPLLLRQSFQDWGPKPFRVLNCWLDDHRLRPFVEQTWAGLRVRGWGAFVLKEKVKGLKGSLKDWNSQVFGDMKT
ncbi:uncharacterized protein LOC130743775 [Lotus japonicus]|uniref:uncharacterized protein LOC130743775 n=1 Tax=Lotus japonicus TaxID=34305 RepID=UPI002582FFAB|nr:uncharacterized protein LOC130743775 [Lotus japonicus]